MDMGEPGDQWEGLRNYESRSSHGGYATHGYAGPLKGALTKMLPRALLTTKY